MTANANAREVGFWYPIREYYHRSKRSLYTVYHASASERGAPSLSFRLMNPCSTSLGAYACLAT